MRDAGGCLGIVVVMIIFWGIVAYLFTNPPSAEDVPWIVAGFSIAIILRLYRQERRK